MRKNSIQNSQARANAHTPPRTEGGWGAALQSLAKRKKLPRNEPPIQEGTPTVPQNATSSIVHLLNVLCPCSEAVTQHHRDGAQYNIMVIRSVLSTLRSHNPLRPHFRLTCVSPSRPLSQSPHGLDEHTCQPQNKDVGNLFPLLDTLDI